MANDFLFAMEEIACNRHHGFYLSGTSDGINVSGNKNGRLPTKTKNQPITNTKQ
jgi:hypothetical protein